MEADSDAPARPSLQDRMLARAIPKPRADHRPALRPLGGELFEIERELVHFGMARLPSRTVVLRLSGDRLVVVSPPALVDRDTVASLEALGTVRDVVVPNPFHHLYTEELLAHFPDARLLAAPGVGRRIPALALATELHDAPPEGWEGELEHVAVGAPGSHHEVLLFHPASGTLLVTDLAFNMVRHRRRIDGWVWRSSGIPGRFGPGRTSNTLLLADAAAVAPALAQAARWPIRRIVPAHGDVIEDDASARFRAAFARQLALVE